MKAKYGTSFSRKIVKLTFTVLFRATKHHRLKPSSVPDRRVTKIPEQIASNLSGGSGEYSYLVLISEP